MNSEVRSQEVEVIIANPNFVLPLLLRPSPSLFAIHYSLFSNSWCSGCIRMYLAIYGQNTLIFTFFSLA